MNKYWKPVVLYIIIFVSILIMVVANNKGVSLNQIETTQLYTYSDLIREMNDGEVAMIDLDRSTELSDFATAKVYLEDGTIQSVNIPSIIAFQDEVNEVVKMTSMRVNINEPEKESIFMMMLPSLLMMVVMIVVFSVLFNKIQGGGGKMSSFGKSKARVNLDGDNKVLFENVAGCDEEKTELEEVVEFLKTPKKFTDIGAKIPKGVLLVGPPGTGKTLLAKAVAGEAGVPFFSISGSDFVEMFVGVGASRVRDLFEQAKKMSPSIIFIDEIDAVGRRRGTGVGGGHDEREQTLNQLLVEMDGFGVSENIIIIAATNRADVLDPALLRPGRFDRQVYVGRPDIKGREAILEVHAKGKKIGKDVDLKVVAQTTAGFTGADLSNLLNEAALLSARENKSEVDMSEIQKAFVKIGIGTEKKTRVISEKEKHITAYHEAGHAILFEVLSELDPVHSVSIIPTGRAGGYTMPLPGEDRMYMTKMHMEQDIICFLGGRAAEQLIIKDVTTGASNDIERATALARSMVVDYGMSATLGPIQFFSGGDWGNERRYGEEIAGTIDKEVKRIVTFAYDEAIRLLEENMEVLHATAKLLILQEKITGEEFKSLFNKETREDILGIAEKRVSLRKVSDSDENEEKTITGFDLDKESDKLNVFQIQEKAKQVFEKLNEVVDNVSLSKENEEVINEEKISEEIISEIENNETTEDEN